MLLSIPERLQIMNLLPKEEDYPGIVEIEKAKFSLAFTPEEIVKYEVVHEGQTVKWNPEGNKYERDIPLTEWTTNKVQEALVELNRTRKLTALHKTVYEKFVKDYR